MSEVVLRRKRDVNPAVDDPDWAGDPDVFRLLFTVVTDGEYSFQVEPVDGFQPDPVTFTRAAGETGEDVAAALAARINDAARQPSTARPVGGTLSAWLTTAAGIKGVARADVTPVRDGPKFRVTLTGPGGSTVSVSPDDEFPISVKFGADLRQAPAKGYQVCVVEVDANGIEIENSVARYDLQVVRTWDFALRPGDEPRPIAGTSDGTTSSNRPLGQPQDISYYGESRMTVRLASITGVNPGSTLVAAARIVS